MKHKIGIICAGKLKSTRFCRILQMRKPQKKAMLKFYEGQIEEST